MEKLWKVWQNFPK